MLRRLLLLATLCAVSSAAAGRCLCPRRFRPVCGTDGKTYDSECNLTCATMKDMSLRLAYTGVCCPKPDCPPVKELICDNKGGTHDNECMFRYAFCVTRKLDGALLRIRKRGPCNVLPQTDRELCDLGCEGSLRDPICDTRGMTHQNLCWLSTAQCLARRDQRADTPVLAFKGPCPILPPAPPKDRLLPPSPPPTQLPEVRATEIRLGSKITQLVLPEDYFVEPTAEPELAAPEPNASAPEPEPKPSAADLEYEYYSSEASAPEPEPLPELQPPHPEPKAKAEPESRPNYQTLSTPATGGPKVGAIELLPPEEGFPAEEELDGFPNLPPLEAAFGEDFLEHEPLDELPEYLSASSAVSELPIEIGTTPHPEPEPKAEISLPEPEPKPELSKAEPEPETYERAPAIREPLEDCSVASCSKAYEPLCDNRGHTHVNHCVYLYSQCLMRKKGEDVQIVFPGPCSKYRPTTTLPRPEPIARAEGKPEPEPQGVLFRRQPKPEPENKPEPEVEPEPESNPEPEIVPEPEVKPPVQPEPHPTFHRQPVLEPRLAPPSVLEPLIGSSSLGAFPPTAPPAFRPQPTTQAPLPCPRCGPEDKSLFLICDNRNTTHQNLCRFTAASCASYLSSSAELIPVHFGPCDGFSATFEAAEERCPAACTLEFYPLCDGRNRTHSNLCAFQTASCELRKESGRGLVLAHLGECGSPLPVPVVDGGPPTPVTVPVEMDTEWWMESRSQPEVEERFDCPRPSCPSTTEPVCDSAGTTHLNVCLFAHRRCVAAAEGRVLTLAHEGECLPSDCAHLQNCSADFAPVCGTDFETYWNECVLRQHQCKEKEAGGATQLGALFIGDCTECLVRCSEEDSKAKVCDTLGDTHTRCRFRMASCIYGKKFGLQLSIAYQGDCCPSPDKCPPLEPTEWADAEGSEGKEGQVDVYPSEQCLGWLVPIDLAGKFTQAACLEPMESLPRHKHFMGRPFSLRSISYVVHQPDSLAHYIAFLPVVGTKSAEPTMNNWIRYDGHQEPNNQLVHVAPRSFFARMLRQGFNVSPSLALYIADGDE